MTVVMIRYQHTRNEGEDGWRLGPSQSAAENVEISHCGNQDGSSSDN